VRAPPQTFQMGEASFRGPTLETVARKSSKGDTAAVIDIDFVGLAQDKILVLTNAAGVCTPGLAQAAKSFVITGFTPAGAPVNILQRRFLETADLDEEFNWQGEVWLRGRGGSNVTLQAHVSFDAGVASNTLTFSFFGQIIPRANVAEF